MPKKITKISKSPAETTDIAKEFLSDILKMKKGKGALVVGLSGELGAGKTAFTQAIARELGIKNKVISPTFVIMKRYPLSKKSKFNFFFHLDAYRLKNEKELLVLGWEELISDENNMIFIEWPENVLKAMPKNTKYLGIAHTKEGNRQFKISKIK